ncbi:hypothetical protein [Laceyella sacchari]|uniref:Uncharacterized protein n=1 Tax=Laceyella sacchari TaxID=37482 RepID=A0ABY5U198_LACSH|nr:hypothetical protein [Laceyella sacchari]UWE03436.1 hypothetical protein NYR52_15250 [Laceyella sacchari]
MNGTENEAWRRGSFMNELPLFARSGFFYEINRRIGQEKGDRCEQDVTKRPSGMKDVIK